MGNPSSRNTKRPARECKDEPRTISTPTPTTIVLGDPVENYRRSKYPNSTVTLFHGVHHLVYFRWSEGNNISNLVVRSV